MTNRRLIVLLLGPIPIITGSLLLSRWMKTDNAQAPSSNQAFASTGDTASGPRDRRGSSARGASVGRDEAFSDSALEAACLETAERVSERLGEDCHTIVQAPFIVAGDLPRIELNRWYRQTIGPAARSMAHCYFDRAPDQPITVLLFSGEASYNRYAKALFGDEGISVYGYYKPHSRTLVMNIATGGGTLVHELTHALVDFDFPVIPDWFNEGLASLHEQCHIRPDERGIEGLVNWRLPGLQEAIRAGRLPTLESLLGNDDFRGSAVGLNYAQARYFCMYLQSAANPRGRDVLGDYYRWFRDHQDNDATGATAVGHIFPDQAWADLDRRFQEWVLSLER